MKKRIIAFMISCILFQGCVSYNTQSFMTNQKIQPNLLPLKIEKSFKSEAYLTKTVKFYYYKDADEELNTTNLEEFNETIRRNNGALAIVSESISGIEEKLPMDFSNRKNDAYEIIDYEFNTNIFSQDNDKKYGLMKINVATLSVDRNWFYFISSAFTVFTINFLGFPAMSQNAEILLSVELYNNKNNLIAKYSSKKSATEYSAIYWGYSGEGAGCPGARCPMVADSYDLPRAAHSKAIQYLITDIKGQIRKDVSSLNKKLLKEYQ